MAAWTPEPRCSVSSGTTGSAAMAARSPCSARWRCCYLQSKREQVAHGWTAVPPVHCAASRKRIPISLRGEKRNLLALWFVGFQFFDLCWMRFPVDKIWNDECKMILLKIIKSQSLWLRGEYFNRKEQWDGIWRIGKGGIIPLEWLIRDKVRRNLKAYQGK